MNGEDWLSPNTVLKLIFPSFFFVEKDHMKDNIDPSESISYPGSEAYQHLYSTLGRSIQLFRHSPPRHSGPPSSHHDPQQRSFDAFIGEITSFPQRQSLVSPLQNYMYQKPHLDPQIARIIRTHAITIPR